MKNVMTRAWEIAKEGAAKFGGKVKEYFAQALVLAWAEIKKGAKRVADFVMLETSSGSRKHKTWVAKITGTHPTYKFNREFIDAYEEGTYVNEYKLFEGVAYDVCDGGNRYFAKVENGEVIKIGPGQVAEMI